MFDQLIKKFLLYSKADRDRFGPIILDGNIWLLVSGLLQSREIFLKKANLFNFYPEGHKKSLWARSRNTGLRAGLATYFLQVRSMLGSSQIGSQPISKTT